MRHLAARCVGLAIQTSLEDGGLSERLGDALGRQGSRRLPPFTFPVSQHQVWAHTRTLATARSHSQPFSSPRSTSTLLSGAWCRSRALSVERRALCRVPSNRPRCASFDLCCAPSPHFLCLGRGFLLAACVPTSQQRLLCRKPASVHCSSTASPYTHLAGARSRLVHGIDVCITSHLGWLSTSATPTFTQPS